MKNFIYNISYFLKEAGTMIRMSPLSNLLSLFCTGLIFFILAMVFSGWWISSEVITAIQGEAEINVYFDENIGADGTGKLIENIKAMEGVREARVVGKIEAYDRMVEILGAEARVLEYFDDNPFSAFIEVKINLDKMEPVLKGLEHMPSIEAVGLSGCCGCGHIHTGHNIPHHQIGNTQQQGADKHIAASRCTRDFHSVAVPAGRPSADPRRRHIVCPHVVIYLEIHLRADGRTSSVPSAAAAADYGD